MENEDKPDSTEKRPNSETELNKNPSGDYSFHLTISRATGVKQIAGELWTIAKSLREGTIKQSYGYSDDPRRVEWEVIIGIPGATTNARASSKIWPDGSQTSEASAGTVAGPAVLVPEVGTKIPLKPSS